MTMQCTYTQLLLKSLFLCLDIMQGIIFYGLKEDEDRMAIKKYLMDIEILKYSFLKPRNQILLCCLISDSDYRLFPQLRVEERVISDIIQQLESHDNVFELFINLQAMKSLAKVKENSALLKRHKILQILETFVEMYPDSEVEALSAELIYHLLSDSFSDAEEKQNPLETLEKFMSACCKG